MNNNQTNQSNQSNNINSTIILSVLLPVIITPIMGGLGWLISSIIGNHYKNKQEIRQKTTKYLVDRINTQIEKFYWPMYILIIRYVNIYNTYNGFRDGQLSISSKSNNIKIDDDIQDSPRIYDNMFDYETNIDDIINSKYPPALTTITANSTHSINSTHNVNSTHNPNNPDIRTDSNSVNSGVGVAVGELDEKMDILNKYTEVIEHYEKILIDTLLEIQNIYTNNMSYVDPEYTLSNYIAMLDRFITYITTLYSKSTNNNFVKDKIDFTKFPKGIDKHIENNLLHLQKSLMNLMTETNYGITLQLVDEEKNKIKGTLFKSVKKSTDFTKINFSNEKYMKPSSKGTGINYI